MSIEGQGHFFTIYFPGFVCFVLYWAKISGESLQDLWSSDSSYISLSDDCHVRICKFTALSSGSFCQIYRVTDEALIAETAVLPNFFLMNVFFALKGSTGFIIICQNFM